MAETLQELDEVEGGGRDLGGTAGGLGSTAFDTVQAQRPPGLQQQERAGIGAGAGDAVVGKRRDGWGRQGRQGKQGRKRAVASQLQASAQVGGPGGGRRDGGLRGSAYESTAQARPSLVAGAGAETRAGTGAGAGAGTGAGAVAVAGAAAGMGAGAGAGGMGLDRALGLAGVANVGKDKPAWQR